MSKKSTNIFGHTILCSLVLLVVIPTSSGYADCRISCKRCNENLEHPALLEVYCAMCEECKLRRREKLMRKSELSAGDSMLDKKVSPIIMTPTRKGVALTLLTRTAQPVVFTNEDSFENEHNHGIPNFPVVRGLSALSGVPMAGALAPVVLQQPVAIPPACPMPPYCQESEEEIVVLSQEPPTTTTTTTTTTTASPVTTNTPIIYTKKIKRKVHCQSGMAPMMPCASCTQPMCPMPCQAVPQPVPCPLPCQAVPQPAPCPLPCQAVPQPAPCPLPCQAARQQVPCAPLMPATAISNVPYQFSSTFRSDYEYLYIGLPKNVLKI